MNSVLRFPLLTAMFMTAQLSLAQLPIGETVLARHPEPANGVAYYLPKTMLDVSIKPVTKKTATDANRIGDTEISITPKFVPDHEYQYYVKYRHSAWRDDDLFIGVGADGLLTTITANATDKKGEIIQQVAELAVAAAKVYVAYGGRISAPSAENSFSGKSTKRTVRAPIRFLWDIEQEGSLSRLNNLLTDSGYNFHISIQTAEIERARGKQAIAPGCSYEGVIYRPPTPLNLIFHAEGSPESYMGNLVLSVPQRRHVVELSLKPRKFGKSSFSITFKQGMLTSYYGKHDSEILAFIKIPVGVLNTIASIPGQLLTVKVINK